MRITHQEPEAQAGIFTCFTGSHRGRWSLTKTSGEVSVPFLRAGGCITVAFPGALSSGTPADATPLAPSGRLLRGARGSCPARGKPASPLLEACWEERKIFGCWTRPVRMKRTRTWKRKPDSCTGWCVGAHPAGSTRSFSAPGREKTACPVGKQSLTSSWWVIP